MDLKIRRSPTTDMNDQGSPGGKSDAGGSATAIAEFTIYLVNYYCTEGQFE